MSRISKRGTNFRWMASKTRMGENDYFFSPTFLAEPLDNTQWRMALYFPVGSKKMKGYLTRRATDGGPEIITLNFSVYVIKSDKSEHQIVYVTDSAFKKDSSHCFEECSPTSKLSECSKLKFRWILWKPDNVTLGENRAKILMNTISRIWNYQPYPVWDDEPTFSNPGVASTSLPALRLQQFWTTETKSLDKEKSPLTGCLFQVYCGLTVLDSTGYYVVSSEGKTFYFICEENMEGKVARDIIDSEPFKTYCMASDERLKADHCGDRLNIIDHLVTYLKESNFPDTLRKCVQQHALGASKILMSSKETQTSINSSPPKESKETQTLINSSTPKDSQTQINTSPPKESKETQTLINSSTPKDSPTPINSSPPEESSQTSINIYSSSPKESQIPINRSCPKESSQSPINSSPLKGSQNPINSSPLKGSQNPINSLQVAKNGTSIAGESSLECDLFGAYRNGLFSDVTVCVGEQRWPVHRIVLCARSPVLYDMLTTGHEESGVLKLTDADRGTVDTMLSFLYSDTLPEELQAEGVEKLYYAAHKYQILPLAEQCSAILKFNLSVLNVSRACTLAEVFRDCGLKASAWDFVCTHANEIFKSKEWVTFIKDHVEIAAEVMHHVLLHKTWK